jgi:hypothetical protein
MERDNIPETADLDLLLPDLGVEAVGEIVLEDRAVAVVGDTSQTVVDEETSKSDTDGDTDAGNNGDPLLLGVLLLEPRLLDFALLHTSRVKVSLLGLLESCG